MSSEDDHTHVGEAIKDAAWATFEKADEVFRGDIIEEAPYGTGSIRVSIRAAGPAGYPVKGDEANRRYLTAETPGPGYESLESEVWFANEEAAQNAGFAPS